MKCDKSQSLCKHVLLMAVLRWSYRQKLREEQLTRFIHMINLDVWLRRDLNLCVNSHDTPALTHLLLITRRFLPLRIPAAACSTCVCVCARVAMCFNEQIVGVFMPLVCCLSFSSRRNICALKLTLRAEGGKSGVSLCVCSPFF